MSKEAQYREMFAKHNSPNERSGILRGHCGIVCPEEAVAWYSGRYDIQPVNAAVSRL
jgi:hypothetical protein